MWNAFQWNYAEWNDYPAVPLGSGTSIGVSYAVGVGPSFRVPFAGLSIGIALGAGALTVALFTSNKRRLLRLAVAQRIVTVPGQVRSIAVGANPRRILCWADGALMVTT